MAWADIRSNEAVTGVDIRGAVGAGILNARGGIGDLPAGDKCVTVAIAVATVKIAPVNKASNRLILKSDFVNLANLTVTVSRSLPISGAQMKSSGINYTLQATAAVPTDLTINIRLFKNGFLFYDDVLKLLAGTSSRSINLRLPQPEPFVANGDSITDSYLSFSTADTNYNYIINM